MLYKTKKLNEGYLVQFAGTKAEFNSYMFKLSKVRGKIYSNFYKGWLVKDLNELEFHFGTLDSMRTNDIVLSEDLADIGKNMKLQPYPYQKEAIKFCLDHLNALLVLPCGSGRF